MWFLARFGFVSGDDIEDAIAWRCEPPGWPGRRRRPPRRVRRVLRIVEELAEACG